MRRLCFVCMIPWLVALAYCGEDPDAGMVAGKVGERVLFVDTIRQVVAKDSGTVFLNFGGAYPDETLAVVVMKDTRERFPGVETWDGKKVRVEGMVTEFEGHPRIILRERGQITLVE